MSQGSSDRMLSTEEKLQREPRLAAMRDAKGLCWYQKIPMLPVRIFGGLWPGPFVVMKYRSYVMGKNFIKNVRESMRNSEHWHKQDLELFAAFTARQLECEY